MSSPYKTVALHTFGCKANFADSSLLNNKFAEIGYDVVPFDTIADIYVINTCSVTDKANRKCRNLIRKLKSRVPNALIGITGCYAQLKPNEIISIPGVNFVVGMKDKFSFLNEIEKLTLDDKRLFHSSDIKSVEDAFLSYSIDERTRSFVKIQDGCNYSCTYCTIPMARGVSRSPRIDQIIKNIKKIESSNINEIILSGINVGDFGRGNNESFYSLLESIKNLTKVPRVRISSIEPNLITKKVLELIGSCERFMPHLHIPLQSGSNNILRKMKRKYTVEMYINKIEEVKKIIPKCTIGADVIVGFPGEKDHDFKQSYDLITSLPISYLHVFPFSSREKTAAYEMKDKVKFDVKKARAKILRKLSNLKFQKLQAENINCIKPVLFEFNNDGFMSGLTDNYLRVNVFDSKAIKIKKNNFISNVRLLKPRSDVILGELLHD